MTERQFKIKVEAARKTGRAIMPNSNSLKACKAAYLPRMALFKSFAGNCTQRNKRRLKCVKGVDIYIYGPYNEHRKHTGGNKVIYQHDYEFAFYANRPETAL